MTIRYTLEQALARLSRIRLRRGRGTEALQQLSVPTGLRDADASPCPYGQRRCCHDCGA